MLLYASLRAAAHRDTAQLVAAPRSASPCITTQRSFIHFSSLHDTTPLDTLPRDTMQLITTRGLASPRNDILEVFPAPRLASLRSTPPRNATPRLASHHAATSSQRFASRLSAPQHSTTLRLTLRRATRGPAVRRFASRRHASPCPSTLRNDQPMETNHA
jgi:hypothetical protein